MHKIVKFMQYPFETGQKIFIEDGPRKGDWEVVGIDEGKVTLRCPISGREAEWARFCYSTEETESEQWPTEAT